MKNVALHNLGCKVNSYELDVIEQDLIENGYNIVPFNEIADVYIINTCTVTNIADRKSRQMLHRAKKENPNAIVIALGCYVETSKKQVEKDPCIDIAVGNNRKKDVVKILMEYEKQQESCETSLDENTLTNEKVKTPVMEMDASIEVGSKEETKYENMELTNAPEHTRAYIKIQDGCNQFCSYCLIPYARGRIRSREQSDVVREIEGLAQKGVKEVVITGIHVSSYGLDRGQSEFIELLQKVHEIEGIERIRLSSLEPRIITQENAKALAMKVMEMSSRNLKSLDLTLNPEGLGKMRIVIDAQSAEEITKISISASHSGTRAMLESGIDVLKNLLESNSIFAKTEVAEYDEERAFNGSSSEEFSQNSGQNQKQHKENEENQSDNGTIFAGGKIDAEASENHHIENNENLNNSQNSNTVSYFA